MSKQQKPVRKSDTSIILNLAVPAILTQISLTLVEVVDTIFIGRLGPLPLAASALIMLIIWNVRMIAEGFGVGLTTCISRMVGAEDNHNASLYFRSAVIGFLILGVVLVPVFQFTHTGMFRLMKMPENLFPASKAYFSLFTYFIPFVYVLTALQFGFRAAGDTRTPMIVGIIMNLLNVFLDWVLIFGKFGMPKMGIRGAAVASVSSFIVGCGILLVVSARRNWGPFQEGKFFSFPHLWKIIRFGVPATIERITMAVSQIAVMALAVNPLGSYPVAAFQIVLRLASLSFMPGFGFSIAASTLVGQSLGAGKPTQASRLVWKSVGFAAIIFSAVAILYFTIPKTLISLFTDAREILILTRRPLRIYAAMAVFLAPAMVTGGGLRGAGETRFPMLTMVASRFCIRLPLCWVFSIHLGLGLTGVWIGMCFDFFIRAIVLSSTFYRGKWKHIRV